MKKLLILPLLLISITFAQNKRDFDGEQKVNVIRADTVISPVVLTPGQAAQENVTESIEALDVDKQEQIDALRATQIDLQGQVDALEALVNSFLPIVGNIDSPVLTSVTADGDSAYINLVFSSDVNADTTVIERGTSVLNFTKLDTVDEGTTTYKDTTTLGSTIYYYRLWSYNTLANSGYSTVLSDITADTAEVPAINYTRFLDSDLGDDANDGLSASTPWKTVGKVNTTPIPSGNIVGITGTFTQQLIPQNGVTYITRGGGRARIQPTPLTNDNFVINMVNADTVTIKNLELVGKFWIQADGSSWCTADNLYCRFYSTTNDAYMPAWGSPPIYLRYGGDLNFTLSNSILVGGFPQTGYFNDLISVEHSNLVLISKNLIKNATHSLLGGGGAKKIVVEGNLFWNQYHHGLFLFAQSGSGMDSLWEVKENFFMYAGDSLANGDENPIVYNREVGALGFEASNSRFHHNGIRSQGIGRDEWNNAGQVHLQDVKNTRMFNNSLGRPKNTFSLRVGLSADGTSFTGVKIFNNAFFGGGDVSWYTYYGVRGDSVEIVNMDDAPGVNPTDVEITYNSFPGQDSMMYDMYTGTLGGPNPTWTGYTINNNISMTGVPFNHPYDTTDNYSYWEPETVRGKLYDTVRTDIFAPVAALVDAGRHLTTITANSSGTTLTVDDPYCFTTNYGLTLGDSICVTNNATLSKQYSRINAINYPAKQLTINTALTVSSGFYVDLAEYYEGTKPNIGMSE